MERNNIRSSHRSEMSLINHTFMDRWNRSILDLMDRWNTSILDLMDRWK